MTKPLMKPLNFDLHAAAVLAPGMTSLDELRAACRRGAPPDVSGNVPLAAPDVLPANERRRASQVVRLTLGCIGQALQSSPFAVGEMTSVFATDEGSGEICQQMLEALATTRQLSPLLFSNSVLNAPSGYFAIGWQNRQSATVVSVGLESFAAGLLCAVTEATVSGRPVLLVAYDPAVVAPMDELLPISAATATAWIITAVSRRSSGAIASFSLWTAIDGGDSTPMPDWLPAACASQSSAVGLATLGLIDAAPGSSQRMPLGGVMLNVQRAGTA